MEAKKIPEQKAMDAAQEDQDWEGMERNKDDEDRRKKYKEREKKRYFR